MRRAVTFSLVVLTVFLWAASLWRLSARVTGMDLVYAGIPAGLALLLLIGFAVSGRIFKSQRQCSAGFLCRPRRHAPFDDWTRLRRYFCLFRRNL